MISEGSPAPEFKLEDQHGEWRRLSEFRGKPVVLYFYPRANTPGCTKQACGIRDRQAEYEAVGATVIGISPDEGAAVKRFHEKKALTFTLLADPDHSVCDRYGVWVERSLYGKKYWGAQRATFIIDADGTVAKVFPKVSPKTHDDVVLAELHAVSSS